ncbi:MerR family transcriptional regulator [Furfurilactobacillus siliginis]|nr:MerR family transcriptional regulator [Furfurilactobacillus siliginis]GEK29093.1 MerR family transcriptional regulator [Furfurilactobacillus siliginis]
MTQTYTIKEVAERFDLTISTIHYYDKQGLLPFVAKNEAGYRVFTQSDLNFIHTICCLKNTGMPIKDIRHYITLCMQGTSTIEKRKLLLLAHKEKIARQQQQLRENMQEVDFKIDRYSSVAVKEEVAGEIAFVTQEKKALGLPSPFRQ